MLITLEVSPDEESIIRVVGSPPESDQKDLLVLGIQVVVRGLSPKLKDIRRNGACIRIRCVPHGVGDLDGVPIVFEGVNLERHPHSSTIAIRGENGLTGSWLRSQHAIVVNPSVEDTRVDRGQLVGDWRLPNDGEDDLPQLRKRDDLGYSLNLLDRRPSGLANDRVHHHVERQVSGLIEELLVDLAHGEMRSGVPEGVGVLPSEQTHVSQIEHEIGCLSPIHIGLPSGVDRIPNRVRSEWHPSPEIRCQWREDL